ncbi:MAG: ferritin-like domain-containing protein, partial [Rhodocyclaceae bacterium]|nr:ferritin-like domain-containing protein [Rhodocyclaceae bacterium]
MAGPPHANLHARAYACLLLADPAEKCAAVDALRDDFAAGRVLPVPGYECAPAVEPGRPARPGLVPPAAVPRRNPHTREGHAALIHAICHIEFNAINLALDCCCRYAMMPPEFQAGWLQVAWEESTHYRLLAARLAKLGFNYGDFVAHDGLWQMALKTASDPLARMALVPRVLEARGLDATPPIMAKL